MEKGTNVLQLLADFYSLSRVRCKISLRNEQGVKYAARQNLAELRDVLLDLYAKGIIGEAFGTTSFEESSADLQDAIEAEDWNLFESFWIAIRSDYSQKVSLFERCQDSMSKIRQTVSWQAGMPVEKALFWMMVYAGNNFTHESLLEETRRYCQSEGIDFTRFVAEDLRRWNNDAWGKIGEVWGKLARAKTDAETYETIDVLVQLKHAGDASGMWFAADEDELRKLLDLKRSGDILTMASPSLRKLLLSSFDGLR